jgi:hypothetical protein
MGTVSPMYIPVVCCVQFTSYWERRWLILLNKALNGVLREAADILQEGNEGSGAGRGQLSQLDPEGHSMDPVSIPVSLSTKFSTESTFVVLCMLVLVFRQVCAFGPCGPVVCRAPCVAL